MKTFINFLLLGRASLDAFQGASWVFLQSSIVSLLYVSFLFARGSKLVAYLAEQPIEKNRCG